MDDYDDAAAVALIAPLFERLSVQKRPPLGAALAVYVREMSDR